MASIFLKFSPEHWLNIAHLMGVERKSCWLISGLVYKKCFFFFHINFLVFFFTCHSDINFGMRARALLPKYMMAHFFLLNFPTEISLVTPNLMTSQMMESLWNKVLVVMLCCYRWCGLLCMWSKRTEPIWCGHLVYKKAINGRFVWRVSTICPSLFPLSFSRRVYV